MFANYQIVVRIDFRRSNRCIGSTKHHIGHDQAFRHNQVPPDTGEHCIGRENDLAIRFDGGRETFVCSRIRPGIAKDNVKRDRLRMIGFKVIK